MPEQYVTSDKRTGLEIAVTGEFPPHQEDRIRIARTVNLFTRLMSTILATENDVERRERFSSIETQLEAVDALIRQDVEEVQRLMRETMAKMGITTEQLDEMMRQFMQQFEQGPDGPPPFPPSPPPPPPPP